MKGRCRVKQPLSTSTTGGGHPICREIAMKILDPLVNAASPSFRSTLSCEKEVSITGNVIAENSNLLQSSIAALFDHEDAPQVPPRVDERIDLIKPLLTNAQPLV